MPTSEYLVLEDFGRFYAYLKIFVVKFCQSLKKDWRLFEDSWINFFFCLSCSVEKGTYFKRQPGGVPHSSCVVLVL